MKKRVAVLGGRTGLLGVPLVKALESEGFEVAALGRADFDVSDQESMAAFLDDFKPKHLYNTVAYTAVDLAEDEPVQAAKLNKALPVNLGRLCGPRKITLVHYSTDFVFDGQKSMPYTEEDTTNPTGVYGQTKLDGEKGLLALGLERLLILRTAWLFGPGKRNFVATILNLAKDRDELRVVHDQIGSPTYTPDLAAYSVALAKTGSTGIFNVVNSGRASWCELAAEAVSCAGLSCQVRAITTAEYPTKAKRPAYSVLDTTKFSTATGVAPRPWVMAVRDYVYGDLCAQGEFKAD
ncbi:dTDP-4-dehydrorhamnose reductase [Fundidesulfovibrio butyratiphilus]